VAPSASARKTTSSAPGPPADPPPEPPAPATAPAPVPVVGAVGAGEAGRVALGGWAAAGAVAVAVGLRAVCGAVKPGRPRAGGVGALAGAVLDACRPAGLWVARGGRAACAAANGGADSG